MPRPRNPSRSRSASLGAAVQNQPEPMGRLVLVVSGEQPTLDVLVTAVRRRFATYSGVEFPPRLVTRRRTIGDTELSTSRRVFREIEGEGGLLLRWETGGLLHGY